MKGVIVEVDLYYKIRTLHEDGESIRAISRSLAVSRLAVKKYCRQYTSRCTQAYNLESDVITDGVRNFFIDCVNEDKEQKLTKQQRTAKCIYDRLVSEKNFKGGESTIRNAVKALRMEVVVPPQVMSLWNMILVMLSSNLPSTWYYVKKNHKLKVESYLITLTSCSFATFVYSFSY